MKLKLKINESTTDSELVHLGMFFSALALNRGAHVVSAPADEAKYTVIIPPTINIEQGLRDGELARVKTFNIEQELRDGEVGKIEGINILTGKPEAPKRRRRTKAEIEAEVAAAPGTTVESTQPMTQPEEVAAAEAEMAAVGNDQPAPTPTAPETTTPAEEPASMQPAVESPSDTKTYTPAEVQKIAVATAGRFGPEKVKAIIAQYPGAARIADLPLTELAGFVAKLNAVS